MADDAKTDQEIRTDQKDYFSCNLHAFDKKLTLNAITEVRLSIHANHLYVLHTDGRLEVISLEKKDCQTNATVERVYRFLHANNELCKNQTLASVYLVTEDWHLAKYQVRDDSCHCLFSSDLKSFQNEGMEIKNVNIASCFEDYISICINSQVIVSFTGKDHQLKKIGEINLENVTSSAFLPYHVDGKKCGVLHSNMTISLYDLTNCKQIDIINLGYMKLEEDSIQRWLISLDLNKVIFVLQDGSIRFSDLYAFGSQRRSSESTSTKSTDRSISTSKYGDKAWRGRLGTHHQKQKNLSYLHKTQILSSKQAKVKSVSSRKVSGFKAKRNQSNDSDDSVIPAPDGIHGYCVDDLCIDPTSISAVYTYNEVSVLCQWNIQTRKWTTIRFEPHERVLLSHIPSLPHCILTAHNLTCIITDSEMGQEQFVNELMVYGGAALADKVCHINKWGRCTIPINTLDAGLKHRQIDTVSFFMKSKENFFSSAKSIQDNADSQEDSPYWASNYNYLEHLLQLDPAFNLLFQNVRDSMGDKHAQIFGRQVLDITMDFLYGLLLDGLEVAEKVSDSKDKQDLNQATGTSKPGLVDQLFQNVRDSMGDKHAQIFGRQVLDITMDFLYWLLLDGLEVAEKVSDSKDKQDLNQTTGYFNSKPAEDNELDVSKDKNRVLYSQENIEAKGENAGHQHFLLLPQCFHKPFLLGTSKPDSKDKQDLNQAKEKLLAYIEEARSCVRQYEEKGSMSVSRTGSVSADSISAASLSIYSEDIVDYGREPNISEESFGEWDKMDLESVIEAGILTNQILALQHYLHYRGDHSKKGFMNIKSAGMKFAVNYIKFDDMEKAKEIITKLGLNVSDKLWELALHCLDMKLCASITNELLRMSALTEKQVSMVTFLNQLQELYPRRDFETLKNEHVHVKDSESHEVHRIKALINPAPVIDLTEECGNLSNLATNTHKHENTTLSASLYEDENNDLYGYSHKDEREGIKTDGSKYYSEVMLDWISDWDQTTRDWIRLDVLLYQKGSDISSFGPKVIWDYMQMNNLVKVMVSWIQKSFLDNGCQVTQTDQSDWPVSHLGPISPEFVNRTELCTDYTRKQVIKAFAKYNIFTDEALNNFEILLQHLNTAGGLLRSPHPLSKCRDINKDEFHLNLICHCVQHNLADYLWIYCNIHRVSVPLLHGACSVIEEDSWLPLFIHFFEVATERNEWKKAMLECSLVNATMVTGQEVTGVGDLLQNGHVITAMATLMYSPHQLNQVTFVTQQLEAFDGSCSETVERAIQMYPKLHLTLFPGSTSDMQQAFSFNKILVFCSLKVTFVTQQLEAFDGLCSETVERAIKMYPKLHLTLFPASTTDMPQSDVSMYHLLQGNSPFDPTRLFGWQSTNTCVGEDPEREMPYFSNTSLVTKHGYTEQLRYTYFLKQGRPSFAYISFLHEEFRNGGPTLSSKRFAVAMGTSMCIAIKNFNHPHISSSCVMFQELLGHDSLLLRTYLQVGNEILTHRNNAVTGPMDKRREQTKQNETEVVDLLLRSLQSVKRHSQEVLQALEAAILAGIAKDRLSNTSFESGQRWIVAVLFCHLMGLPYTTVFLETCAQTNQWLPFIWFSQIHQYSKEQLLALLHYFKSHHLQEHLRYVIVNATNRSTQEVQKKPATKKRSDMMAKEVRMTLYSKIGLKDKDSDVSTTSDEEESHTFPIQQESSTDDSIEYQISYDGCPGDVFGVVFAAQTSKCPWKSLLVYSVTLRNPLFAELAACLQNAQTLHCLCGWLVAMMEITDHTHFLEDHGKLPWQYHLEHLDIIIDIYITNKWGSLLVTGFDIFQQNSPLLPFLQFYAEFTERRNFSECRLYLNEFKQSFFQFHNEKAAKTNPVVHIGDSAWLEKTTYRIINYLLTNTSNMYEVTELLKILDSESITLVFKTEDPDYRKQYNMMRCIQAADLRCVNLSALLSGSGETTNQECDRVISLLTDRHLFDEARNFASIAALPADHVTLAQMKSQKKLLSTSELWNTKQSRMNYYKGCLELANKYSVSSEQITQFFLREAKLMSSCSEQAGLLEMCLKYMEKDTDTSENSSSWTEIYKKMWTNRIQERIEITEGGGFKDSTQDRWTDGPTVRGMSDKKAKQELICVGKMPSTAVKSPDLSEKEVRVLLMLVGTLLKEGMISESCRVTSIFDVYSQDLALTLTFIRMSLGVMGMENLTPEMMHLLRTPPGNIHRQSIMAPVALLRNSSTISLMSNIQPLIESVTEETEQKISTMEILLNHCEYSKNTCIRILTAFKIAVVLDMGYDDVVTGDDYIILGSLLKTSCTAKFRLAADFLGTSSLSSEEVAGFLSDAILRSFKVSLGQPVGSQALVIDPGEGFSDFHQIIRLCKNPSVLGQRLVDTIAAMTVDVVEINDKVLTLQTEVLILAHDCYTAACDMEGISNILRAARILTAHLEAASEFQLMTRLLTGVGRYNEMIYVFDSLKQNHQFELLLGKGMEKEFKLKTAILDYLKRYHPGDNDTYSMVALKFMMYREIAQLLHDNANKILDTFKRKPLENNNETQASLQKAAQYYSEAAESFIKDNCLRQAQNCVRRARLVALQLKNLASNQQYINLTVRGASLLIADHPVFSEAFIISEAYQQKETWAAALCNNVIIRGDMKYLQEFRSHIRVTPQLVEDAVEKYHQSQNKSPQATSNVKKLLQYCKDVKLRYRIAKSLGLRDIVTSLEKSDAKNYIMDFASQS